jgi:hypothetical protein
MKTIRELILERHQSAEAKLKGIRAEDLAACTQSGAPAIRQGSSTAGLATTAVRFWREALWPWRRAWIGIAAAWAFILAFSLAAGEAPRTASARPPRPDPEVRAVLREQKQLLTQLLGSGAPPLVSNLRMPGPRSAAEPPTSGTHQSLGAAMSARSGVLELASAAGSSELAVPEDGRTPETFAQA